MIVMNMLLEVKAC